MVSRRAYRRVSVNEIDRQELLELTKERGNPGTVLGLDIARNEIVACLRWDQDHFERPWKIINPKEIGVLVELCELLKSHCTGFSIGLESTGTYGDVVRYALSESGISVQRVSGKAVSDYHEIFDGVPSQHDGKDAAMVAELVAHGKGTLWPFATLSEHEQILRHQVFRIDAFRKQQTQWLGRIEALTARHWPELTSVLKLNSVTLLNLLSTYGSPAKAIVDPKLEKTLRLWGKKYLKEEKIAALLLSARSTKGLPMNVSEISWMQELAAESLRCHREQLACEKIIKEQVARDPVMQRYSDAVGAATLAVLWSEVGDPVAYSSAGAYVKALGLNLKERSSGKRLGQLAISKRGPAMSRRWLFYWAMRAVQRDELKGWYEAFIQVGNGSSSGEHRKMKGLTAMMRKLCKSLWHVRVHNKDFDYSLVINGMPPRRRRRRRKAAKKAA